MILPSSKSQFLATALCPEPLFCLFSASHTNNPSTIGSVILWSIHYIFLSITPSCPHVPFLSILDDIVTYYKHFSLYTLHSISPQSLHYIPLTWHISNFNCSLYPIHFMVANVKLTVDIKRYITLNTDFAWN